MSDDRTREFERAVAAEPGDDAGRLVGPCWALACARCRGVPHEDACPALDAEQSPP